jgi:hypothetical protein
MNSFLISKLEALQHQVLARVLSSAFAMHILQCNPWCLVPRCYTSSLLQARARSAAHHYKHARTQARTIT